MMQEVKVVGWRVEPRAVDDEHRWSRKLGRTSRQGGTCERQAPRERIIILCCSCFDLNTNQPGPCPALAFAYNVVALRRGEQSSPVASILVRSTSSDAPRLRPRRTTLMNLCQNCRAALDIRSLDGGLPRPLLANPGVCTIM